MKISLAPHKHVLVSPRTSTSYNPRSFLASIVRGVAPQISTADSPQYVTTSLSATTTIFHLPLSFALLGWTTSSTDMQDP